MKYYEMHEIVYSKLKDEGKLSWDTSVNSVHEMWAHETNVYLERFLKNAGFNFEASEVLDLGTGTGTSALFAASKGAHVTAVEISSSAVDMAIKNAENAGYRVNFIQADVLEIELGRMFNVVIDSTILHCLVGQKDRSLFYKTVKKHLVAEGYFFVNTMIASGDSMPYFPEKYFVYEDDILWSTGIPEIVTGRKIIDGKSYFPHRTIMSEERQLDELKGQGFQIVEKEIIRKDNGCDLVALLKL